MTLVEPAACIWCGERDPHAVPEHIIPECLGCPAEAVFWNSEVCTRCNNRLSGRDTALCDGFDFLRLAYGQPGKKGRPPALAGRPNARTKRRGRENVLQVNLGPGEQLLDDGYRLKAPTKGIGSVNGTFERSGDVVNMTYRVHLFYQPHFVRGIYKIALETIALFAGVDEARSSVFDDIRQFVLDDDGPPRRCLIGIRNGTTVVPTTFSNTLESPRRRDDGGPGCVVPMRLMDLTFVADCTPSEAFVERSLHMRQFSAEAHDWRVLPWELDPSMKT